MIRLNPQIRNDRIFYGRLFFGFVLVTWLWRFYNHVWLHQLAIPVYYLEGLDIGYDELLSSGIPDFITGHYYVALFFDISLLIMALTLFIRPQYWILAILFSIFYYFYIVCFNSYSLKITHSQIGILWMSFPFWANKNKNFILLWQGARYFIILIYCQAFYFKVLNGTFLREQQAEAVVKYAAGYSLNSTGTNTAIGYIVTYFLSHPFILNISYNLIILLEGTMALGLFTKKFDRFLFWIPILVHISSFIFMSLAFFEMMIVSLLFYHRKWGSRISKTQNSTDYLELSV